MALRFAHRRPPLGEYLAHQVKMSFAQESDFHGVSICLDFDQIFPVSLVILDDQEKIHSQRMEFVDEPVDS